MFPPSRRLLPWLGGLALTATTLAGVAVSAPDGTADTADTAPTVAPAVVPVAQQARTVSSCIGYCDHPTNAGKVFRWGVEEWRQEFETGPFSTHWQTSDDGSIGQQNGMLTIKAESDSGTVKVWPDDQSAVYGRWEARVRAFEKSTDGVPYRFTWQLVPVGGNDRCGTDTIVLASYVPGDGRVRGAVRTRPDHAFQFSRQRDLRSRAWHTYAVEVADDHISWFVDTKVMRTERRPEALAGVEYRPQFVMEAPPKTQMRASWMQMDWVRHYTLDRPNAKSIAAPDMTETTSTPTC